MVRNPNIIEQLINLLILAVIVVASILAFTFNYWLGLGILFIGLLMLIVFRFRASEHLELLLTIFPLLLVAIVVGSLVQGWLINEGQRSPIAALDRLAEALPNSYPVTIFISVLIGVVAALLLIGILFLLLDLSFVSVIIEDGQIKGKEKHKQRLEIFGGPGRVRIYPGQVVVFHKHGKITRAAGLGTILLKRAEKIKVIIPLGNKAGVQEIENVLTKDRIALTLNVAHGAEIELVSGTKKRLEEMQDKVARDGETIEILKGKIFRTTWMRVENLRTRLVEMEAQIEQDREAVERIHSMIFQPTRVGWITAITKRLVEFLTGERQIESVAPIERRLRARRGQNGETIRLLNEYRDAVERLQRDRDALEQLRQQASQAVQKESVEVVRKRLIEMEAQEEPDKEIIELLKKYKDMSEQLQKDEGTIERLQKIVDSGQTVGDEHDQCFIDIAKLVAAKGPDPWAATKSGVGVNLRDVFMANEFEDLFKIEGEAEDLKAKIDQRKIAEIEKFVLDKVKGSKVGDGIVLNFVDINEVYFPETIQEKLKKVSEARLDEQAAIYEARAIVIRARARAQAKILAGQGEGEARAAFFRELLRELKREEVLQGEQLVTAVLELIGRMISAQDIENFVRVASAPIQGQSRPRLGPEETNGSQGN